MSSHGGPPAEAEEASTTEGTQFGRRRVQATGSTGAPQAPTAGWGASEGKSEARTVVGGSRLAQKCLGVMLAFH